MQIPSYTIVNNTLLLTFAQHFISLLCHSLVKTIALAVERRQKYATRMFRRKNVSIFSYFQPRQETSAAASEESIFLFLNHHTNFALTKEMAYLTARRFINISISVNNNIMLFCVLPTIQPVTVSNVTRSVIPRSSIRGMFETFLVLLGVTLLGIASWEWWRSG